MSLDVYRLKNGKPDKLLLSISDLEYRELLPAIDKFKLKTGLYIDLYKDLKLNSGLQALIDVVDSTNNGKQIYKSLLSILQRSEIEDCGIIFVGD